MAMAVVLSQVDVLLTDGLEELGKPLLTRCELAGIVVAIKLLQVSAVVLVPVLNVVVSADDAEPVAVTCLLDHRALKRTIAKDGCHVGVRRHGFVERLRGCARNWQGHGGGGGVSCERKAQAVHCWEVDENELKASL
jgi:hypothetical protein